MGDVVPMLNADKRSRWEEDWEIAFSDISSWLSEYRPEGVPPRGESEALLAHRLQAADWHEGVRSALMSDPSLLSHLRALTRRDIGKAQFATFLRSTEARVQAIEQGTRHDEDLIQRAADLLAPEIDHELAPWIADRIPPSGQEALRAGIVATDRRTRRESSTQLRYAHEQRQLKKLEAYFQSKDFRHLEASEGISDLRRDLPPGTYSFRRGIFGLLEDGKPLSQSVDALVMPWTRRKDVLPIFIEAKSMTDMVNPNKRQKEEAQKAASLRRAWQADGEHLFFLLLLGGTVPRRYLEVESSAGLDWVWEHRLSDLDEVLAWYKG